MSETGTQGDGTAAGTAEAKTLESEFTQTRGVETLACANFQSLVDEVDKVAAEYAGVELPELIQALGHMVDHGLGPTVATYDIPREVLLDARDRCKRAAKRQYPEHY